jgi:hypothetical protein
MQKKFPESAFDSQPLTAAAPVLNYYQNRVNDQILSSSCACGWQLHWSWAMTIYYQTYALHLQWIFWSPAHAGPADLVDDG